MTTAAFILVLNTCRIFMTEPHLRECAVVEETFKTAEACEVQRAETKSILLSYYGEETRPLKIGYAVLTADPFCAAAPKRDLTKLPHYELEKDFQKGAVKKRVDI